MSALLITREKFAARRGFREAELHGLDEAHARSWSFGAWADGGLRFAYRVGIDRFREEQRLKSIDPAGPGSAA
jgi:hypothetical protein